MGMLEVERPQTTCEGCKARDRMIQNLAGEVDRLIAIQDKFAENVVTIVRREVEQTRTAVAEAIGAAGSRR